ncbi:MAG: hypothetical protein Q8K63_02025 [Acidimicrobiales bacterium]|nr:hypothetical protein [Acidimicrobiales bacterium]
MNGPRRSGLFGSGLLTDGVIVVTAALIGLRLGLVPIKDNSSFTHLATGIEMVADSWLPAIPRVDGYTYTALGREWVVQSWLPAWIVGIAERAFGMHAVLLLSGITSALLATLMVTLARTGSAVRTAFVAALTLLIAAQFWAPRPLMVGLICFALTVLAVERRWKPWWLVLIGWVWVQSHGSFPLGVVFLGALWLGTWLPARDWRVGHIELRAGLALAGGIALGAVNPLGPKLVFFPLTAISKREVFSHITEWRPLAFDSRETIIAIVGLTIAAVICIRRRIPWRVAVPVVVFGLLAWSARRNVATLAIVVAWALGHALRRDEPVEGSHRVDPIIGLAVAAMAAVFAFTAMGEPALNTRPYPVASVRFAERNGRFEAPHRVLSKDFVGNYIDLRRGPSGDVFIDDRFDMYPAAVPEAYFDLLHDRDNPVAILDRYKVDTLIWPKDHDLPRRLRRDGWRVAYSQKLGELWVVLFRSSP